MEIVISTNGLAFQLCLGEQIVASARDDCFLQQKLIKFDQHDKMRLLVNILGGDFMGYTILAHVVDFQIFLAHFWKLVFKKVA